MLRSLLIISFIGVFIGAANAIPAAQFIKRNFKGHMNPMELPTDRREKDYGEIPIIRRYFKYGNLNDKPVVSRSPNNEDTLDCEVVTLVPGDEVPFVLPFTQDARACRFAAKASNGSTLSLECPYFKTASCDSEYLFIGDGDKYNKLYCNGNQPEKLEGVEQLFFQYGRREESQIEEVGAVCFIKSQEKIAPTETYDDYQVCPESCGKSDINLGILRIFGGEMAREGEFPWMVRLTMVTVGGRNYSCGGTILNTRNILTAAHCVESNYEVIYVSVVAGVANLTDKDGHQTIQSEEWAVHKSYSTNNFSNDIAILRLSSDLHFNEKVKPICLAPPRNYESELATTSGWGRTENSYFSNDLLKVGVKVTNRDACERTYSDYDINVTENQLCASLPGKDSCFGDSGGPLALMLGSRWYEIGVVSFGIQCAHPLFPGVYTSVSAYNQWIRENIQGGLC